MDAEAAKLIGAAIAVLPLFGVGMGIGNIFSSYMEGSLRNPSAADSARGTALLGFALTEATGLFALVIAFLILFS